jgi:hypothetical protein
MWSTIGDVQWLWSDCINIFAFQLENMEIVDSIPVKTYGNEGVSKRTIDGEQ